MRNFKHEQVLFFEQNVDDQFLVRIFRSMEGINGFIDLLENSLGEKSSSIIPSALRSVKIVANRVVREINNEKRRKFSELTHDLRNTIAAVIGNADIICMFWVQKRYQLALKNIGKLKKAVRLSKNLVVQASGDVIAQCFLDKFDNARQESCVGTIEDVIQIALNLTQSRKIGQQEIGCIASVSVKQYETELLQVLLNLFANAFDAMREKKYDKGELPVLRISANVDGDILSVTISDNGVGMSEDTVVKIFADRFTTKKSGRGIGLTICKKNIKKIGGRINVSSSLCEGTTFTVRMPL